MKQAPPRRKIADVLPPEILTELEKTMTDIEIGEKFGFDAKSICKYRNRIGMRNPKRKRNPLGKPNDYSSSALKAKQESSTVSPIDTLNQHRLQLKHEYECEALKSRPIISVSIETGQVKTDHLERIGFGNRGF